MVKWNPCKLFGIWFGTGTAYPSDPNLRRLFCVWFGWSWRAKFRYRVGVMLRRGWIPRRFFVKKWGSK